MSTSTAVSWHRSDGGVGNGVRLHMSGVNQRARIVGEKYEIERHLASGGMGELYVARHVLTTQRVALKVLDRRLARSEASIERFLREVRLGAKIGHPAVVQVYDAGLHMTDDGPVAFLAMELLTGMNLAERIVKGDVTQAAALDHIMTLLEPLAAAHSKGVVHRDLKPENVFLEQLADGAERVRLLDLGIAREAAEAGKATLAGQALGTVYYMAPEQSLDARSATPVSDVWSLGAMLYQVLSGTFPFDGDTAAAVLLKACRDPHVPLIEAAPHVDPRLAALVDRCLSKSSIDRPADAIALRDELAPLLADPSVRHTLDAFTVTAWTFHSADPAPREDPFASTEQADSEPVVLRLPTPLPVLSTPPAVRSTPPAMPPGTTAPDLTLSQPPLTAAEPSPPTRTSRLSWTLLGLAIPLLVGAWLLLRSPTRAPHAAPTPPAVTQSVAAAQPAIIAPAPTVTVNTPTVTVEAPAEPAIAVAPSPEPRRNAPSRRPRTAADPTPAQSTSAPVEPAVAPLPEPSFAPTPQPVAPAPRPAVTQPAVTPPVVAQPVVTPPAQRPATAPAQPQHAAPHAPTQPDFVTF